MHYPTRNNNNFPQNKRILALSVSLKATYIQDMYARFGSDQKRSEFSPCVSLTAGSFLCLFVFKQNPRIVWKPVLELEAWCENFKVPHRAFGSASKLFVMKQIMFQMFLLWSILIENIKIWHCHASFPNIKHSIKHGRNMCPTYWEQK